MTWSFVFLEPVQWYVSTFFGHGKTIFFEKTRVLCTRLQYNCSFKSQIYDQFLFTTVIQNDHPIFFFEKLLY
jgi:hypothetical protein